MSYTKNQTKASHYYPSIEYRNTKIKTIMQSYISDQKYSNVLESTVPVLRNGRQVLAEKSNLSANYIYEIENGNYMLGCIPIIDICNALEVTPTELLSDFITLPKNILKETLATELDELCEKDCKIILTLINIMKN